MATTYTPDQTDIAPFQKAAKIVLALHECSPKLQAAALKLLRNLASGELGDYQEHATCALLSEILFPNADDQGRIGLGMGEAEQIARDTNGEAKAILEQLDEDEATFAARVQELMDAQGLTQAELAKRVGIGQPAVSLMLKRQCRPQYSTIVRFAEALGVAPKDLWPPVGRDDDLE
jgi:lambda repressor-like predicted transcriptional regulator